MPEDLETVDIPGVEIMAAVGPIHGLGSPPGGDTYTAADLQAISESTRELTAEGFRPPAKIGHDTNAPRVGWIDNTRPSEDGSTLLGDLRDVPKKFAGLIKAGAYRARSPELCRVTSQATGKVHDQVIGGMAWLGARRPAIQKLSDLDVSVLSLFEGKVEVVRAYEFENEDPPASERLLEAVVDLAAEVAGRNPARDDSRAMSELTLTEEQRAEAAEKLGVKPDELTPEKLFESIDALKAKAEESKPDDDDTGDGDGDGGDSGDEASRAFEAKAEELKRQYEGRVTGLEKKLHETERREFMGDLVKTGKIEPGEQEKWEQRFDRDPATAREFAADLKPHDEFSREYGSDEDGDPGDEESQLMKAYEDEAPGRLGVPKEALV